MTKPEIERLATLEAEMRDTREDLGEIKSDVKAIRSSVDQAKGGWRILIAVGAAAGGLGAGAIRFLDWLNNIH
jgi:hypothetical protein